MTSDTMTIEDKNSLTLLDGLAVDFTENADLAHLTWYRVGGHARVLVQPRSIDALSTLMQRAHATRTPVHILGKGANLLVLEGYVPGIVVHLNTSAFKHIEISEDTITTGAGTDLAKLINTSAREGLGGLDVLAGIPATVGGAIRMNAGGAYGDTGSSVKQVTVMDAGGRVSQLGKGDVVFSYRHSSIQQPLILEAQFQLKQDDPQVVRKRVMEVYDYKKSTQPLADKSAGCAFKNPPKDVSEKGAGQLIDEAGLKGFSVRSAKVSEHHANFIVVQPGGRASDIFAVMKHVQRVVGDKMGIELQREVVVWGDADKNE